MGAGQYYMMAKIDRKKYESILEFKRLLESMVLPKEVTGKNPPKKIEYCDENGEAFLLDTKEWNAKKDPNSLEGNFELSTIINGVSLSKKDLEFHSQFKKEDMQIFLNTEKYDCNYVYGIEYGDYTFKDFIPKII